jgi:5-methylcytosine-specific restriction endonuclease McrA
MISADFKDCATGGEWAALFAKFANRPFEERRTLFAHYVRSAAWNKRRLAEIAKARNCCTACGEPGGHNTLLRVHHISYANLGRELPHDLIVLCPRCFDVVSTNKERRRILEAVYGADDPEVEREREENKRRCGHLPEE